MEEIKFIDHIKSLDFGEVAIWGVDISEMDYEYDQYSRLLLKEELVKINRLKNKQSRLTSVLARSGLRILSGVYLNKDPKKIILKNYITANQLLIHTNFILTSLILQIGLFGHFFYFRKSRCRFRIC